LVLARNYYALYQSYEFNPLVVLTAYADSYGWVVFLAAAAGYIIARVG
jgi:hypothetical protein